MAMILLVNMTMMSIFMIMNILTKISNYFKKNNTINEMFPTTPHDFQEKIQNTFNKNSELYTTTENPLSDQFIFSDQYVISEPDSGSTRYDRRLIIKLPANQPPDTAMHALGIKHHSQGHKHLPEYDQVWLKRTCHKESAGQIL